jgi:hypothetical protein
MNSTTTDRFWKHYCELPSKAREQAREAYSQFVADPYHPALHFKRIHSTRPIFSVRVGIHYRAVGVLDEPEITWFWIGSHADYDKLVKQLRKGGRAR